MEKNRKDSEDRREHERALTSKREGQRETQRERQ